MRKFLDATNWRRPMMTRFMTFGFAAMAALALSHPAQAARSDDLQALSRVLGELHHIRRNCEPRAEAEIWRNRMRRLVELEEPDAALRASMVEAFNNGFRAAEAQFGYCDRDARDHAAAIAQQADAVTARLLAPIYDSLAESGDAPNPAAPVFVDDLSENTPNEDY